MLSNDSKKPLVCLFDSGIGGINLLCECVKKMPQVDFAYFADNYNVPYGNLSGGELLSRTVKIFDKMSALNPAAAVVACNTVTAQCISALRARYKFRIVGIQPAIKPAAAQGDCIVLATPSTAESVAVRELTLKYGRGRTRVLPCPQLAAYIENNIFSLSEKALFNLLPQADTEGVVLGCTHYTFIKNVIGAYYNCRVWDGIEGTTDHLREILGICDHLKPTLQKINFYSGNCAKNRRILNVLLAYGQDGFIVK